MLKARFFAARHFAAKLFGIRSVAVTYFDTSSVASGTGEFIDNRPRVGGYRRPTPQRRVVEPPRRAPQRITILIPAFSSAAAFGSVVRANCSRLVSTASSAAGRSETVAFTSVEMSVSALSENSASGFGGNASLVVGTASESAGHGEIARAFALNVYTFSQPGAEPLHLTQDEAALLVSLAA
ncbi:MAG: hypothetical protein ACRCWF_17745 [Beijerinckiaceae bacterium]